jgi:signal transduction histidine kinase
MRPSALTQHLFERRRPPMLLLPGAEADGPLSKPQFVENYLHPEDAAAFEAAANRAMRTGGNFHAICRIRQKSGVQRWLQFDGKFELTDTGEPSRHVGVIADITERKALEQEAEELSERLITLQEEERQLIAQELHDSTVQHLVAANLNLMGLRVDAGSGSAELWDQVEASILEAMKELRTFSYLMPALQGDGLWSTIRQYVDGYAARSGLTVKLRSSPKIDSLPFQKQRTPAHCSGSSGQRPSSCVRVKCPRQPATDRRSNSSDHH